ncbi:YjeF N-terminal domain-like protein [Glonium stellatum]|uniref:Enhancer of mRNA-decapping protein 3 n=1 Tax=Glonium stellatum TaxID=574774 RepID=A0A8E2JPD2_9PEZI|nr:YjeF N-terminal domain-like protein [Glonium stellatum]
MATTYVNLLVSVSLKESPEIPLYGRVKEVIEETTTLVLSNAVFEDTNHVYEEYKVEGKSIADITVLPDFSSPQPAEPQVAPQPFNPTSFPQYQHVQLQPAPSSPTRPKQAFVDPAILSMGKRPPVSRPEVLGNRAVAPAASIQANNPLVQARASAHVAPLAPPSHATPQEAPATPIKPMVSATAAPLPINTSPFIGVAKGVNARKPSAATLTAPFSAIDIADAAAHPDEDTDDPTIKDGSVRRVSITKTRTGKPMDLPAKPEDTWKRTRRGGKARRKEVAAQQRHNNGTDLTPSPEAVRKGKGNGWRQTPLLQDPDRSADGPPERTPGVISGKVGLEAITSSNRKTRRQKALEAKNGWATEDATDIQELPDFDFAENLSKFDKRSVFDQIRNEDTTADEDRLVSYNRIPAKPGTYGGKNLHPTENVLDNAARRFRSASESDSDSLSDFDSGHNSRRAMSRASNKRLPSLISRTNRSFINRPYASSSHATGSPKPGRTTSPPGSPFPETSRSCLRIASNNRKCHTITPGGMLAVEESAEIEFGLTEDLRAENAGRGIAEVALSAINPGGRRLARDNPNTRPVIVVLAGNHRGGARAIAAARHLHARGPRVMVALLGFERVTDWDRDVRRQVELFRKFGGWVRAWTDVEGALKRLEAPPELIVDALLGRHKEFEALGDADRQTVLGIVGWANKSRAAVLAVETPSGVGGSTGEVAILEGEPLEVRAKYIVCLGAPRSGLLKALQNGTGRDPEWLIWVVDIGINRPWRNSGISGGKGVKFGESWLMQIRFVEGEAEAEGLGMRS